MDQRTAPTAAQGIGPLRVLLALVLGALAAALVWTAVSAVWNFFQPVYLLSPARLLVTLAACGVALAGVRMLWQRPHPGLTLGGLLVPALWVLSFISSIGVLTLPVALVLTVVLIVASRRAGGGAGGAAATGLMVALALAVLLFASPWIPAVKCGDGVVRTSSRPFSGSGSSGGGTASVDGSARGTFTVGGVTYGYRCDGADLVEFRRIG